MSEPTEPTRDETTPEAAPAPAVPTAESPPEAVEGEATPAVDESVPWKPSPPQIFRYKDAEALAEAAAKRFLDSARRAVEKTERFIVVPLLVVPAVPGRRWLSVRLRRLALLPNEGRPRLLLLLYID